MASQAAAAGAALRGYLDLVVTDTSAMALWFSAALLQLVANVLLTQSEFAAAATVQQMASVNWMCASSAHAWALRSLADRPNALIYIGLNIGSALFVISDFCPPPPNPTLFYVVMVAALFYAVCAFAVSRISPLHKVRFGAAWFVAGASTTAFNMVCNLFWPSAPFASARPIAAGLFLVAGGYTWTTVVAEREFAKYEQLAA